MIHFSSTIKTAFITTLKQLPMIGLQWIFLAGSLPQKNAITGSAGAWIGSFILLTMIGMTFWVAYKTERINKHPLLIYHMIWLIPVLVIALKMMWVVHVGLFLLSLYLYARPLNQLFTKQCEVEKPKSEAEDSDDVYEHPSWLKIKNSQFDDVDISHNTASQMTALSSNEFYEFQSTVVDQSLFVIYLSTLNPEELQKFYDVLPKFYKPPKSDMVFKSRELSGNWSA